MFDVLFCNLYTTMFSFFSRHLSPHVLPFDREIVRHRTSKRTVLYRAPCGRRLRSLDEVFNFLRITGCKLEIDCFCFDFWVHCFTEFEPARKFCSIKVGCL